MASLIRAAKEADGATSDRWPPLVVALDAKQFHGVRQAVFDDEGERRPRDGENRGRCGCCDLQVGAGYECRRRCRVWVKLAAALRYVRSACGRMPSLDSRQQLDNHRTRRPSSRIAPLHPRALLIVHPSPDGQGSCHCRRQLFSWFCIRQARHYSLPFFCSLSPRETPGARLATLYISPTKSGPGLFASFIVSSPTAVSVALSPAVPGFLEAALDHHLLHHRSPGPSPDENVISGGGCALLVIPFVGPGSGNAPLSEGPHRLERSHNCLCMSLSMTAAGLRHSWTDAG